MVSFQVFAAALALVLQVTATLALTSDKFNGDKLDASIWTTYNPDAANVDIRQDGGIHLVDLRAGNQHHMWHKPAGAQDSDGWNYAYRIYQDLSSPSEIYEVEVRFLAQPEAGQRYQEIGLFVGYDSAENNRQWPFHKFACISDHLGTYVNHHAVRENSYTEGLSELVSVCPDRFRLKYDGTSYKFSVRYPGESEYRLFEDNIISDAGLDPTFVGIFAANAKHNSDPAPVFETGFTDFRVIDQPPLTSDEFDDSNLDPNIWTSYNPDAANVKVNEDKGTLNINYPEGRQHHMWHKPAGAQDTDGWNYAYRIYQNLRSPSEEYEVVVRFVGEPEAGKRYQEIGLFVGYDNAENNRQWPFHKFACISDHIDTYVNHHAVRENSYTEGLSEQVSMCPDRFRLKYDGNSYTFSVRYPGKSKYRLVDYNIISDAGADPKVVGIFVANAKHNSEPAPAFSTSVAYFRVLEPGVPKTLLPDCTKAHANPNFIHQSDTQAWQTTGVTVPNLGASGTVAIDKVKVLVADSMNMYRVTTDPSKVRLQSMCCDNIELLYKLYFTANNPSGSCSGVVTIPLAVSDSRQ